MNIERLAVADLHPDPANARAHPERNIQAIRSSLARFGQVKPIVIDENNVVRAGNGTLEAAKQLGWDTVLAVRTTLAGSEATAYAIADNRTGELAGWDEAVLAETLRALRDEGFDMDAAGYAGDELDSLLAGLGGADFDNAGLADAIGDLPDGDKSPFQQMTFTLNDKQAETVKAALDLAKGAGAFGDTGNENSNGNALARIAGAYLGRG